MAWEKGKGIVFIFPNAKLFLCCNYEKIENMLLYHIYYQWKTKRWDNLCFELLTYNSFIFFVILIFFHPSLCVRYRLHFLLLPIGMKYVIL